MKKFLSITLAALLTFAGCCGDQLTAFAGQAETPLALEGNSLNAAKLASEANADQAEEVKGEVIVMFENYSDLNLNEKKKVQNYESGDNIAKKIELEKVWNFEEDGTTMALASSKTLSNEEMIKRLEKQDTVAMVAPNYKRKLCSVSNDKFSKYQWGLTGDAEGNGISVESVWNGEKACKGSKDVVVAVIDTGVDYTNPELKNQMWKNPYQPQLKGTYGFDFINGDDDPMDDFGHGTHCAGIIGAQGDNGEGISGVNQNVKIMALKAFDADGYGDDSSIVACFNYIYKAMTCGEDGSGVNVKAINCSFSSEGNNEIMKKIINMIGEKGAITVVAAGNESTNLDEEQDEDFLPMPACFDSPYLISVAAIGKDGKIASYSNYGSERVDLAAPGSDILSTVSYYAYNPGLHLDDDVNRLYIGGSDVSKIDATNLSKVEALAQGGFNDNDVTKLHFSNPSDESKAWQYAKIDYTVPDDYEEGQEIKSSAMIRCDGKDATITGFFDVKAGYVLMLDIPEDYLNPENENYILNMSVDDVANNFENMEYTVVDGKDDRWAHLKSTALKAEKGQKRCILIIGDCDNGDFDVYMDDFGISKNQAEEKFEKLDYMSGTSMATPHVAGAVALKAAQNIDNENYSIEQAINDIMCSMDCKDALPVQTEGSLDLSKNDVGCWIGISNITVDAENGIISINGGGFDANNLTVSIKRSEDKEATKVTEFLTKDATHIEFKDSGNWINNVVDISISGSKNGKSKTAKRSNVYLIKGKQAYELASDLYVSTISGMTTDGKLLYTSCSDEDALYAIDLENEEQYYIANMLSDQASEIFESYNNREKNETYDFRFGDDLVYMNGKVYVIGAFCAVSGYAEIEEENGDEPEPLDNNSGIAYTAENALLAADTSNRDGGSFEAIELPEGLDRTVDYTIGAYNGKLYLAGGYTFTSDGGALSKAVYSYDAETGEWNQEAELPKGRAGGKLVQSGGALVYTLGYSDDSKLKDKSKSSDANELVEAPKNLVFDGEKWSETKAVLKPLDYNVVSRDESKYCVFDGGVGICKQGLVYTGFAAENLGDTFTYDLEQDAYKSTRYHYCQDVIYGSYAKGVAVGSDIFVYDTIEGQMQKAADAVESGLITISAQKSKHGKFKGTGEYLPGESYTVKAVPKAGYYVKSLTNGDAKAEAFRGGLSSTAIAAEDTTVKATFGKLSVQLKTKHASVKAGKSYKLKLKVKPARAGKQLKMRYKSSNRKYATVSANGVVHAKSAGKGKSVTVRAYVGSSKKAIGTATISIY